MSFTSCNHPYRYLFLTSIIALFFIQDSNCQLPDEDIGVRDVHFVNAPLVFPHGTSHAGFEFYADSGATLNGIYDIGCTVCLSDLDFVFTDTTNIIAEMSGSGLINWQSWVLSGTCIIGTITVDLAVGTAGYIFFPIVATNANAQGEPFYSSNLININLQPHPFDPSNDSNDSEFNWTYTIAGSNCLENIFVSGTLTQDTINASAQITSDIFLSNVTPAVFNAGFEIGLLSGFEVETGTVFEANIKPCSN